MAQCGSEPWADDAKGSHAHLEQLEQLHLKRRAVSRSFRQHFLLLPVHFSAPRSLLLLSVNLICPSARRNGNPLRRAGLMEKKRGKTQEDT